jgi:hypothetical protein
MSANDTTTHSYHTPSQQEIQDYLDGYNRLIKCWTRNSESAAAKAKGLYNYEKWFKSHGITIYQDQKTRIYKLGPAPQDEQVESR